MDPLSRSVYCLLLFQDFADFFFNICGQHILFLLIKLFCRPAGSRRSRLVDLHYFTLCFRVHRFMLNKTWKFKLSCSLLFFEMSEIILPGNRFSNDVTCKNKSFQLWGASKATTATTKTVKKQNNNTVRASPFILHFFAVVARLRRETS